MKAGTDDHSELASGERGHAAGVRAAPTAGDESARVPLARPLVSCAAVVGSLAAVVLALLVAWADFPYHRLAAGAQADRVVVLKSQRRLELFSHGRLLAAYPISLGAHPRGPKQQAGDGRTPEGRYVVDYHKADSAFHRALHLSYPSAADWARATSRGVDPGGQILIHGVPPRARALGRLQRFVDWTDGCIAVTDGEIEQIFAAVPDGTPVDLRP